MIDAVVAGIVVMVLGWLHHQHQAELDRRGVWMGGVNADISDFKQYIDAQTYDRWTQEQDDDRTRAIWRDFLRKNPALVPPDNLPLD